MRQQKYILTAAEFEALRPRLGKRMDEKNVDAAYSVMVRGESVISQASKNGVTRQALHRVVRDIFELHQQLDAVPDDWVRVVVTLPPDMAKIVEGMQVAAKAGLRAAKSKGN